METDDQLMERVAGGDLRAFDEIVRRHEKTAWDTARRFTGDSAEAEDLAQEAFLRVLTAAPRYRGTGRFRAYLLRVLGRLCLDWAEKKRPQYPGTLPETADRSPSPAERVEASGEARRVQEALARLPENQRMAIILKYYEDMSYADIAQSLDATEKAVERLLERGRGGLRKLLLKDR
jgi:RNA polymerase sigma-70 factor (ECF subfamily)